MLKKKDPFDAMVDRAKAFSNKTIVFPEGEDKRVADAVKLLVDKKTCNVIVLGKTDSVKEVFDQKVLKVVKFIDPTIEDDAQKQLANKLYELRKEKGMTPEQASELIKVPIYYGAMLVKENLADGMVAGAVLHSADVMRPTFQIIKQRKDILKASSCFIMEVPNGRKFGENGLMVFSDCGTVLYPSAEELAGIAIASRDTAKNICGMEPRIAMLSYSTKAESTDDQVILKEREALRLFKEVDSTTIIDAELQADSAILPTTASRKCPNSDIKGDANVLIFPDINAGNIAYKLSQRFGGGRAIGPIMQGLNKPVNDLSRSATPDEIYLATIITLLQSQN